MKHYIIAIILVLTSSSAFASAQTEQLWKEGNDAYAMGEFSTALEKYSAIEGLGKESDKLYFNIANTYYKLGNTGKSILYYERSLKLNPANKDAAVNLEIARLGATDKIETINEVIFVEWIRNIRNACSSNKWCLVGFLLLAVTGVLFLFFRHLPWLGWRKTSFVLSCVVFAFALIAFLFSASLKAVAQDSSYCIITASHSNVKSAPNATGNNLFIIHTGTKVHTIEQAGEWSRVELTDGRQGWMLTADAEVI